VNAPDALEGYRGHDTDLPQDVRELLVARDVAGEMLEATEAVRNGAEIAKFLDGPVAKKLFEDQNQILARLVEYLTTTKPLEGLLPLAAEYRVKAHATAVLISAVIDTETVREQLEIQETEDRHPSDLLEPTDV
jgi:hypothetical protein